MSAATKPDVVVVHPGALGYILYLLRTHRLQALDVGAAGRLHAVVRMMDQARRWLPLCQGSLQRDQRPAGIELWRALPANAPP